jgi:hypothetical protein
VAPIVNMMIANVRLLAELARRQSTQFVIITSKIYGCKSSNTIQLPPNN